MVAGRRMLLSSVASLSRCLSILVLRVLSNILLPIESLLMQTGFRRMNNKGGAIVCNIVKSCNKSNNSIATCYLTTFDDI